MQFEDKNLLAQLESLSPAGLDQLPFGVIGFDVDALVCRYNAHESAAAGLAPDHVLGTPLFTDIAQCMNNFMVAQRFEDSSVNGVPLDETIDFMLTWRMKPTKVKLRMLSAPGVETRYVLLLRLP